MTSRFLMCEPQYFDVNYVINPWMTDNVHRVGRAQAQEQWNTLNSLIQDSAEVELIEPKPGLPDMPFTANAGLVVGDRAVLSNFRHPERQIEEPHFEHWFRSHGFAVHRLPRGLNFEGAGDALLDRHRGLIWTGYGHRSDRAAGPHLQDLLGLDVITLQLTDERFYHLDTCFCPLTGGYIMYYPAAFSAVSQARIAEIVAPDRRISVPEADALNFACNAVNIGNQIILNRASAELVGVLAEAGFRTVQSPLSEFLRAGGASKCLVLRLEDGI